MRIDNFFTSWAFYLIFCLVVLPLHSLFDIVWSHTQETPFWGWGLTPLEGIQSIYSQPHQQGGSYLEGICYYNRLYHSPIVRETWVQSQTESYQRLKKWCLIPPCLTLTNIRYVSRVKWSNPGKGVAPSPTPRCSSYWKGSLRVKVDYSRQFYLLIVHTIFLISQLFLCYPHNKTKR